MTAEEYRKENNIEGEFTAYTMDGKRFDMHIDEFAESYAKQKVLEALEKEVPQSYVDSQRKVFKEKGLLTLGENARRYYHETVKPKYE